MKADVSRSTFDPRRHATSVRKQQGRVDLDADWNEQQDIDAHLRATTLLDVVGAAGAPIDASGLGLVAAGADLGLSAGRYYVDGVLCENESLTSVFAQPDLPAGSPVIRGADGKWRPSTPAPDPGVYVAYVDVWTRHLSVVEDPTLREVALGGPDTTTRAQTVWQVRLLHAGAPGTDVTCADDPPGWAAETDPSTGTLAVRADPTGAPSTDCIMPLSAPYRGLDNQYYRVEIRTPGAPGTARYVHSKDNGSVCATWVGSDSSVLTVKSPGRDGSTGFENSCWVQLTDDLAEMEGRFGTLAQVDRAEGDQLTLKTSPAPSGSIDIADFPLHPKVRRWDGHGTVPADGSEVDLGQGIKATFATGTATYRTGDYWSFAARAVTHDVEWPRPGGVPTPFTPHGVRHSYDRLGVATFDGTGWTVLRDCRTEFAPLVDQLTLAYAGGDGQAVGPDVANAATLVALPQALSAVATMGGRPVAEARVRFTVTAGNGQLGGTGTTVDDTTDADGLATTTWSIDSATALQQVTAELLGDDDQPIAPALTYAATLLTAAGVSYDPAASPTLAGTGTVQAAIDRLAATSNGGCSTLILSPGAGWVEALQSLPAATDTSVCFKPGLYESDKPVQLSKLGNLRLSGNGRASVLRVTGNEAAILVDQCTSVAIEDLTIAVTDYPTAAQPGRLGVVTVTDTPDVELSGVVMSCPNGDVPRAACLVVRTGGEQAGTAATRSVRVTGCDFAIGNEQIGVLVINAEYVHVAGNTFRGEGTLSGGDVDRILVADDHVARLRNQLVYGVEVGTPGPAPAPPDHIDLGDFNTGVTVGNWKVRMNSTVSREEWTNLIATNPPTDADTANPDALKGYLDRVATSAVEQPTVLPAFNRTFGSLSERLRARPDLNIADDSLQDVGKQLIIAGDVDVTPAAAAPARTQRSVEVSAGNAVIRFDSPLSQEQWNAALAESPPPSVDNPTIVVRHVRSLASRMLRDQAFGDRFAGTFRANLKARAISVARQGVVLGGQVIGTAVVAENEFSGVAEGVHVGTSFKRPPGGPVVRAAEVHVRANTIALLPPIDHQAAPRGVFVGNAERALVDDNSINPGPGGVQIGIEMHGSFGRHVRVRGNCISVANGPVDTGVEFVPAEFNLALWEVVDNFAHGARLVVNAPEFVRQGGNV